MGLDIDLDPGYELPEDDLTRLASGNLLPAGMYPAQVTDVKEVEAKSSGSEGVEFEFTVLSGAHHGQTVKDTLWNTETVTKKRRPIFLARLGVTIKNAENKYVPNPAVKNWKDTVGARVNIEVEIEEYDKTKGGKGHKNKVAFNGLHPYDPTKAGPATPPTGGSPPNGPVTPSGSPSGGLPSLPAVANASRYDTSDL